MRSVISTIQTKLDCGHESLPSFFSHARESCKDGAFLDNFYTLFSEMVSLLPPGCSPDWLPALVSRLSHRLWSRPILRRVSLVRKMLNIHCVCSSSIPSHLSESTTCHWETVLWSWTTTERSPSRTHAFDPSLLIRTRVLVFKEATSSTTTDAAVCRSTSNSTRSSARCTKSRNGIALPL